MRKLIRYFCTGLFGLCLLAAASLVYAFPAIGAVVWPAAYGMEYAGSRVVVDQAMPAPMRAELSHDDQAAMATVGSFYGGFHRQPYLVACSTQTCDRKMGERGTDTNGALGATLLVPFAPIIRLAPQGISQMVLTHEFSHAELHYRIGYWAEIRGAFPAWFDEGVAVLVSGDARYLNSGTTASQRCARNSDASLPTSPFDWGPKAGKDHMLYADAACRVLQWMQAHDGKAGLLKTLDAVSQGATFTPENGRPSPS
jgi:hypothetical protein